MKVREPQWLLSGGYVHKMSLGDSISNIKQSRQNFWDEYNKDVIANWERLAEDEDITMEELNELIGQHWNIYDATNYSDEGNAIKNDNVKTYQENYHNKYGFGNTDSFWNGFSRLGTDPAKQTSDYKREEGQFVGDDYYGGQTHRRRASYFNAAELASANEAVKGRGWEFVEDATHQYSDPSTGRKMYILRKKGDEADHNDSNDNSDNSTVDNQNTNTSTQQYPRLSFDNTKPKKSKLNWSDWIPLTMQLTNDLLTNSYINQQQKKMKFPLKEAVRDEFKITNDYYARTGLQQNAELARRAAGQYLTSDINHNLRIRELAEEQAEAYANKAAQMKSTKFAQDTLTAQNVRNKNMASEVETANYNRLQNAAAWNNILNANLQQAAKNLQAVNSYIGNMYQSFGEALKTKRLNEQGYQKAYNQYLANKRAQEARNAYSSANTDITKWGNLEGALQAFLAEGDSNYMLENSGWAADAKTQLQRGLTDAQKQQFTNWLNNSTSEGAQLQRGNWHRYQDQVKSDYYNLIQGIKNWLAEQNLNIPSFVDNQWNFDWLRPKKNKTSPLWTSKKKEGGIIVAKNGSKFSDFTRQYSRELQHVRKSQDERNKTSLKHLDKQLERLNREQIILLRSAFK